MDVVDDLLSLQVDVLKLDYRLRLVDVNSLPALVVAPVKVPGGGLRPCFLKVSCPF